MFFDFIFNVRCAEGDVPTPFSKSSVCVYRFYPFIEIFTFSSVLLVILALNFENKGFAVFEFYDEVGEILVDDSAENITNCKAKVVIFCPQVMGRR